MSLKRKASTAIALALSSAMVLAGCGGSGDDKEADDNGLLNVEVFSMTANAQGEQKGWFAKLIKDKFNMKMKVIAPAQSGNAETIFETRSATGQLGDLIVTNTDNGRLEKLVKANLVADMTPYLKKEKNLQKFKGALDRVSKVAGKEGVWGAPSDVATQSPAKPSAGDEPGTAPHIRWDYYRKVGYPKMNNLDDFLKVLKLMQDKAREETGKRDIYALSLFKDWDQELMKYPMDMASWYGYNPMNTVMSKADGTDDQPVTQKDGIYVKMLRFLNKADQMGLVDPDSSTQTWDNLATKVHQSKVLADIWCWLGQPAMNTVGNKAKGIGFMLAPVPGLKVYADGFLPKGHDPVIALGAKAKNKQRLVDFIDWLYSPEGVYATATGAMGQACPEKMCWVRTKDGNKMTDFGVRVLFGLQGVGDPDDSRPVPKEFGGGQYGKGVSMMHFTGVHKNDLDPTTHETYNPELWKSELAKPDALRDDWSAHMDGAKTALEWLEKHDEIVVANGAGFIAPQEDSAIKTLRGQIKSEIVSQSWKAVFAKSDAEFDSIMQTMRDNLKGLGYEQVEKIDMANAKAQTKARQDIVVEFNKQHKQ
ncbi:ABC transporter substrate-binding protein [Bifidobacterium favimelis]|uniref:Extracellular solute-binding protein n=1 Tax=Bifidobacterium favimelis TaxID=3122979 RepID=A0ABU8ZPT9_9BIFI